jgi:hypothetical protein
MTAILSFLGVLGIIGALGAVWDLVHKRRHRTLAPSDADQTRAEGTLDYYAKVWDSSSQ